MVCAYKQVHSEVPALLLHSLNTKYVHATLSSISGNIHTWVYSTIAGIDTAVNGSSAGWSHILLRPAPQVVERLGSYDDPRPPLRFCSVLSVHGHRDGPFVAQRPRPKRWPALSNLPACHLFCRRAAATITTRFGNASISWSYTQPAGLLELNATVP